MLPGYKQPGALTGTLPTQDSLRPLLQTSIINPSATTFADPVITLIHLTQSLLQLMDSLIPATDSILAHLFHLHGIQP